MVLLPLSGAVAAAAAVQMAVYSYPYFPDCLAVALAVARLPGQALGTGSGIHAFQGVAEEAGR